MEFIISKDERTRGMKIQTTHRSIYKITTIITDINPAAGSHIVNILTNAILCNPYNLAYRMKMSISRLQKLESINRILVICDLNIGDAVNLQSVIMALRDYFADVDIDYAINKKAVDFIQGNSDIPSLVTFSISCFHLLCLEKL